MSTTIQAEASTPQKKMQECNRCKAAGFPNQLIGFEKIGEDPVTGKIIWKLINENGEQHKHKSNNQVDSSSLLRNEKPAFQRKRVVDISTVTDLEEARKLLSSGWEYKTSYPATIANIPHYVLVKRQ
ncbi:MAG TPA: hypothetical protein VE076_04495 [Nitrososphaeraceae archaeon]|jgi:hypothetical protein|nr:hypothetical protein [Nitrososphaeraceae archaeon]